MTAMTLSPMASFRVATLPWSNAADDERRFQRIATGVIALALALGLVVPLLPVRQADRLEVQPLPAPMARLLLERPATPAPPPPTKPETSEPAKAQPEAAADKPPAARPPRSDAAPVPPARNPVDGRPPGEQARDNARRKASGVGLLAMSGELAAMTGAPLAVQLQQDIKPGPGVGQGAGAGVGAGQEAGIPVRELITRNATQGSGGINTAGLSRDTGGAGLAGRSTTLVEGVAGGGGGGGPGGGGSAHATGPGGPGGPGAQGAVARAGTPGKAGGSKASRSIEEIKLVFERNKGAIYALYNRALRDDPALQGKVVLELRISPAGQVDALRIVSSELKSEELERKLLARVRQFDFGARDVEVMVLTWPVDFLPS